MRYVFTFLIIVFVFSIPMTVYAADLNPFHFLGSIIEPITGLERRPWDNADMILGGIYTVTWLIDWGQTREIAVNPDYYETNKILGPYPTTGEVDEWAIKYYIINLTKAELFGYIPDIFGIPIGSLLRKGVLINQAAIHAECVHHNDEFGIGVNFRW